MIDAKFPEPLQRLFEPKRYKVLYGGRGAGRSWGCARALLLIGTGCTIRVLCARELQISIADSVHKLLSDQIIALGLGDFYDVQQAKIIGKNGTTFSFEGIKNNPTKIKSYEGVDYCWIEEANKVSKTSWEILIPTIRKAGSEIWITFNPELATDYTYQRFVKDPPENSFVIKMTYKDNPWFPAELLEELAQLKKRDHDAYMNVWEGNCLVMLEGAVFAKELRAAQNEGRLGAVPWDRESPVDTFWDLGRRDMTSIWFAQRVALQYRLLEYYEASQEEIHHYLKICKERPYTYGTFYLPHDASAKRLGEKRSIEQIVRGTFGSVVVVPRTNAKANAINAARLVFPNCWFDEKKCEEGIERLRHYRYRVIEGQLSRDPLHDVNSNGADAFMTMATSIKGTKNKNSILEKLKKVASDFTTDGWMAH